MLIHFRAPLFGEVLVETMMQVDGENSIQPWTLDATHSHEIFKSKNAKKLFFLSFCIRENLGALQSSLLSFLSGLFLRRRGRERG